MAKDWIDYANLGSNIAQNLQLHDLQNKLGTVVALAAGDRARAEQETKLRETVFQAHALFKKLKDSQNENPAGVLAIAKLTLKKFAINDVTTASFGAFDDKERVQQVNDGFENLAKECSAALSPAQRSEAELCVDYLLEQEELHQLCLLQPMQEQLQKMQAELELAREKSGSYIQHRVVSIIVSIIMLIIGLIIFIAAINDEHATSVEPLVWGLSLAVGATFIMVVAEKTKLIPGKAEFDTAAELEKKRAALLAKWPALNPESSIIQSLQKQFRAKSVDDVLKVRAEREAVIATVLKTEEAQP